MFHVGHALAVQTLASKTVNCNLTNPRSIKSDGGLCKYNFGSSKPTTFFRIEISGNPCYGLPSFLLSRSEVGNRHIYDCITLLHKYVAVVQASCYRW
jgi:hypothetical protein